MKLKILDKSELISSYQHITSLGWATDESLVGCEKIESTCIEPEKLYYAYRDKHRHNYVARICHIFLLIDSDVVYDMILTGVTEERRFDKEFYSLSKEQNVDYKTAFEIIGL